MNKFILHYVECCLPDYFSGHHLPVLQVPVNGNTTRLELANGLFNEVKQGILDDDPRLPENWTWEEIERAINACVFFDENCKHDDVVFPDLEKLDSEECGDCQEYCCYSFFVIETIEEESEE